MGIVTMIRSAHRIMITFLMLSCFLTESTRSASEVGDYSELRCKEVERQALLKIKEGLIDENNILSSWRKEEEAERSECCEWIGIRCDDGSGHVVMLDLSPATFGYDLYTPLAGNISSSLAQLQRLNYLDLSTVDLERNSVPSFIGNLSKLRYLNLSSTCLEGQVPPQLGNLSSLQFLDLSFNDLYDVYDTLRQISMENLGWASRLSSLRVLDLSLTNMSTAYDWVHVVNNLPHLTTLLLRGCRLPDVVPLSLSLVNSSKQLAVVGLSMNKLSDSIFQWLFNHSHSLVDLEISGCSLNNSIPRAFENMAALEYLDLSYNLLKGPIPRSFGNITTLRDLDLSNNYLDGSIPKSFGNMATLEYLSLRNNLLGGEIPKSIWEICTLRTMQADGNNLSGNLQFAESSSRCSYFSLEYLDLSSNRIIGSLPNFTLYPSLVSLLLYSNRFSGNPSKSIGQLSKLEVLNISKNSLSGVMSEAHFSKLLGLNYLDLSYNPGLVLDIPSDWIPPFQLEFIYLGSCKLGPLFPKWLQTQKKYLYLDISNSSISDSVPDNFWNSSTFFRLMNLSNNLISGTIQDSHSLVGNYPTIDLSSNQLEGAIPHFLFQVPELHLSDNRFTSLSSVCPSSDNPCLSLLDISYNQLVGELPDCWVQFYFLNIVILTNNKLSGRIPHSLLCVEMLDLGNNNFTEKLPSSNHCTNLVVLNLGENRLVGPIPTWVGDLQRLIVLNFRSNQLNGSLPSSLCQLAYLQLLDLSLNNISGTIPNCVGNFRGMKKLKGILETNESAIMDTVSNGTASITLHALNTSTRTSSYDARVTIIWKGKLVQYRSTLRLLKSIDLSHNNLVGEISGEFTKLDGLVALNLSRNNLSGEIPVKIGQLKSLDSLDLSRNHLSGTIPSSLSELDFLNTLDMSINNLSGKIPTSTQLQSFDVATYMGNPELCGLPLPKKCPGEGAATSTESDDSENREEQDSFISRGFYVCTGLGFFVGFWGLCGALIFIKSWRYAYFSFLDGVENWLYIMIAVHKAKILRMIKS